MKKDTHYSIIPPFYYSICDTRSWMIADRRKLHAEMAYFWMDTDKGVENE